MKKKSKKGLIFVIIAVIVVVFFVKNSKDKDKDAPDKKQEPIVIENRDDGFFITAMMGENTTVGGIDYFIVKIFNPSTNNLDFVVIPDGCYFEMTDACYDTLSAKNADLMQKMNLSSIALYFNKEARYEHTITALEDLLGLEVDYYEVFSEEEFIRMINLVTPLNYNLVTDLSYINRKGVSVEVPSGTQYMDGEKALAILKSEDSYESKVDQAKEISGYLNEYYSFIFSLNSIDKLKEYYTYVFDIMQSDATYDDYTPYYEGLYNVNPNEIGFHVMYGQLVEDGRYFIDTVQMQQMVQKIKERPAGAGKEVISSEDPTTTEGSSEEDSEEIPSTEEGASTEDEPGSQSTISTQEPQKPNVTNTKDATIQILNSTSVNGLAKKWQKKLNDDGYNVTDVTNYEGGSMLESTKILVKDLSLGSELKQYFPTATIEKGDVPEGFDIVVILSSQDKNVN